MVFLAVWILQEEEASRYAFSREAENVLRRGLQLVNLACRLQLITIFGLRTETITSISATGAKFTLDGKLG